MRLITRQRLVSGARLSICGLAMWFVVASVSFQDSVVLSSDGARVTGIITDLGDRIAIRTPDGLTSNIARSRIALDEQGAERLTYGLLSVWRDSGKLLILCGVTLFLAVPFLQGLRFCRLLRAADIQMGLWQSVKLAFAGNFLNFAAPLGSTAGDVFKAFYASRHTEKKTEAAAMVFIDRAVGLGTLLSSVTLIALLSGPQSRLAPLRTYLFALVATGLAAAALYLSPQVRRWAWTRKLAARLPRREQLARIDRTLRALLARPGVLLRAVAATVVLQGFAAAAFVCVCMALGMAISGSDLTSVYAYFSAGEIVKALPGPPQGLGTMELAYGYFFANMGSGSQIVSAAVAIRLVNLVCSLPGIAIVATGGCRPARRDVSSVSGACRARFAARALPIAIPVVARAGRTAEC